VNRTLLLVTSIVSVGSPIDADHSFPVHRTHGRSVGQDKAPLRSRAYVEECARRQEIHPGLLRSVVGFALGLLLFDPELRQLCSEKVIYRDAHGH
jgi:hypothetical protein